MNAAEILGSILCVLGVGLGLATLFIPRKHLLKINLEAVPKSGIGGHFVTLKVIHAIPFWTLNRFGKTLRIGIDASLLLGLAILVIPFYFKQLWA